MGIMGEVSWSFICVHGCHKTDKSRFEKDWLVMILMWLNKLRHLNVKNTDWTINYQYIMYWFAIVPVLPRLVRLDSWYRNEDPERHYQVTVDKDWSPIPNQSLLLPPCHLQNPRVAFSSTGVYRHHTFPKTASNVLVAFYHWQRMISFHRNSDWGIEQVLAFQKWVMLSR